jgi:hypothetical protein
MVPEILVDVSYAAPQAHGIINATLNWKYPPRIIIV